MKKLNIIITSFLVLVAGLLVSSCEPDNYSLGKLPEESTLNFEVTQDLVASPGGNVVKLKNLTPGIIPYWSYTDSEGKELGHTNLGETSISFPFAGTYNINFSAFDKGGYVSSSKTVTVVENDTSLFSDPRWAMLTNGVAGKTWVITIAPLASVGYAGAGYINTTVKGDWEYFPGDNPSWSGIEVGKNWGEVTFDLDGGYHVKVVQTSLVAGSTQQTTSMGTFGFALTPDSTNDRISLNGGLEMLHTNIAYTSHGAGFSFSDVRLVELTETTLKYSIVGSDGSQTIVNLVPKTN